MKSTNKNGKTKQSKKSMEESVKIIIAACLFPFAMLSFSIMGVIIFLIIMANVPQKGIPHEQKEPIAIETATQYIEEKYGDVLTYSSVHEWSTGFFGEPYWEVEFVNEEDISFQVRVFEDYENECMYIEHETYYCYYIKDRMMEWMDSYLKESSLEEYVLEYNLGMKFSTEWELDCSAEEIVNQLSNKNDWIRFKLYIPERERNIYDSGQLIWELNELVPYLDREVDVYIYVFENQVYDEHKDRLRDKHHIDSMKLGEEENNGD